MKFHQVTMGQKFIYQDKTYVKVSPVLARSEESGEQCFMRRADSVQAVAEPAPTQKLTGRNKAIDAAKLTMQFDDFINTSINAIKISVEGLSNEQEKKISNLIQKQADIFRKALNQYKK